MGSRAVGPPAWSQCTRHTRSALWRNSSMVLQSSHSQSVSAENTHIIEVLLYSIKLRIVYFAAWQPLSSAPIKDQSKICFRAIKVNNITCCVGFDSNVINILSFVFLFCLTNMFTVRNEPNSGFKWTVTLCMIHTLTLESCHMKNYL